MSGNYKLSICIPTYNREKYLNDLLDSITSQKIFQETNYIEVVIDNWPSNDNTEAIVKSYTKMYWDKIKYFCNSKKIWMCPAIMEALFLWSGEYCWTFSDDDLITDGTLEIFLDIINKYSPSLIFWREITKWEKNIKNNVRDIKILKWINDFSLYISNSEQKLFKQNTDIFTFMSTFCVKKDFFKKNLDTLISQWFTKKEIEYHYFNFALIWFAQVYSDDIIAIINSPITVLYTPNNDSWKPNIKIVKDLKILINQIKKKYTMPKDFIVFLHNMYLLWIECIIIIPYLKKYKIYKPIQWLYHKIFK